MQSPSSKQIHNRQSEYTSNNVGSKLKVSEGASVLISMLMVFFFKYNYLQLVFYDNTHENVTEYSNMYRFALLKGSIGIKLRGENKIESLYNAFLEV